MLSQLGAAMWTIARTSFNVVWPVGVMGASTAFMCIENSFVFAVPAASAVVFRVAPPYPRDRLLRDLF